MPTCHLLISGKVQGVFYRVSAKAIADKTSITGWIKNTPEGNVEAIIAGSGEQLQKFLEWCQQGPSGAEVAEVIVTPKEDMIFANFTIEKGRQ